jgi:hypothetical protein
VLNGDIYFLCFCNPVAVLCTTSDAPNMRLHHCTRQPITATGLGTNTWNKPKALRCARRKKEKATGSDRERAAGTNETACCSLDGTHPAPRSCIAKIAGRHARKSRRRNRHSYLYGDIHQSVLAPSLPLPTIPLVFKLPRRPYIESI